MKPSKEIRQQLAKSAGKSKRAPTVVLSKKTERKMAKRAEKEKAATPKPKAVKKDDAAEAVATINVLMPILKAVASKEGVKVTNMVEAEGKEPGGLSIGKRGIGIAVWAKDDYEVFRQEGNEVKSIYKSKRFAAALKRAVAADTHEAPPKVPAIKPVAIRKPVAVRAKK